MCKWFAVVALCAFGAQAWAGTLLYEPFNYTVGDALAGKTAPNGQAWAPVGPATGDDIVTASTNLQVDGLPPAQGNSIFYQGIGKSARVALADLPISSGTVYYSLAFQIGDIRPVTTPVFIAGFNILTGPQPTQATVIGARLFVKAGTADNTFQVGVSKNSSTVADILFDGVDRNYNETQFVVAAYQISPDTTSDDVAQMWVNPDKSTFAAGQAPNPTLVAPAIGPDLQIGTIPNVASFLFRQGFQGVPYVNADELRVGTEWADVTSNTPSNGGGGGAIPLPAGVFGGVASFGFLAIAHKKTRAKPA